jgi:hypothetical protein
MPPDADPMAEKRSSGHRHRPGVDQSSGAKASPRKDRHEGTRSQARSAGAADPPVGRGRGSPALVLGETEMKSLVLRLAAIALPIALFAAAAAPRLSF